MYFEYSIFHSKQIAKFVKRAIDIIKYKYNGDRTADPATDSGTVCYC